VPLEEQFEQPHGLGGLVAGEVMAWRNRGLNAWTLRLLGVRRTSRVLEVGFGPGVGIRMAAALARRGRVAGVDPSSTMVKRARWRNRKEVRARRVDLRRGDVLALPWPAGAFTHAFSVNTFHEWDDPAHALAELRRVLAPGGRVALTAQSRGARDLDEARVIAARSLALLGAAGFGELRVEWRRARPLPAHCLLGTLPVRGAAAGPALEPASA